MELRLSLIPAPEDPTVYNANYQKELREFKQSLQGQGLLVDFGRQLLGSWEGGFFLLGDFLVKFLEKLGPLGLAGIAGAWIQAKNGRKVRLKVGDLEAEAQSVEEVERLLVRAQEIQQRNQPKAIHEP